MKSPQRVSSNGPFETHRSSDAAFVAGAADVVDEQAWQKQLAENPQQFTEQADLFAGKDGSLLWAVSAGDGRKLQEIKLGVLPVFDGLIAAAGRLTSQPWTGKLFAWERNDRLAQSRRGQVK